MGMASRRRGPLRLLVVAAGCGDCLSAENDPVQVQNTLSEH
jgi:hypothetical protein